MSKEANNLKRKIAKARAEMEDLVRGGKQFSSIKVIKKSRELDQLVLSWYSISGTLFKVLK